MTFNRDTVVKLLRRAADEDATEIHFKVPGRPHFRIAGSLVPIEMPRMRPRDSQEVVFALCALAQIEIGVGTVTDCEFSFGLPGVGRFRTYVYRQRGSLAATVQRVGTEYPSLAEIGLPVGALRHIGMPGLVLLCGGQRVALQAALVSGYNTRTCGHIAILEAPLTYLFEDAKASIAHRELGTDVPDLIQGVRQAVRLRVDVLFVGDIDTPAEAQAVLAAAEADLPVVCRVSAPTADEAQWWIARMFDGRRRADAERRLEGLVKSVLCVPSRGAAEFIDRVPELRSAV